MHQCDILTKLLSNYITPKLILASKQTFVYIFDLVLMQTNTEKITLQSFVARFSNQKKILREFCFLSFQPGLDKV